MRKGAYPGTFDPPTIAHVAIAEAARAQCGLDRVDLVVNARPLGKDVVPDVDGRVEMLHALAATRPWLGVVVTELRLLVDIADGYDVLVLGADKWTQVLDAGFYPSPAARDAAVARLPDLAVAPRHGHAFPDVCVVLDLHAALADVSSTAVRAGRRDLVPPEVLPYLQPPP
jgi:nicotinate-nucleotide adenylyltransferase